MSENNRIERTIGFLPGVGTLVGFVIGASIFISPGALAAEIGPSVWLSYTIAGLMAFTVCFVYAQIGSMIPESGANYLLCSLTLGGYGGFLYILFYAFVILFMCPLMALGIANYLIVFIPGANVTIIAVIAILITGLLNLFSTSLSAKLQIILISFVMFVIVVFGAGGIANANWSHFSPAFPVGVAPVLGTVLTCYFSFTGFNALTEMAGDIKEPGKNIPPICFIGFVLIMIMYVGVCVGLVVKATGHHQKSTVSECIMTQTVKMERRV